MIAHCQPATAEHFTTTVLSESVQRTIFTAEGITFHAPNGYRYTIRYVLVRNVDCRAHRLHLAGAVTRPTDAVNADAGQYHYRRPLASGAYRRLLQVFLLPLGVTL